jgi:deoxyribonuclease-4
LIPAVYKDKVVFSRVQFVKIKIHPPSLAHGGKLGKRFFMIVPSWKEKVQILLMLLQGIGYSNNMKYLGPHVSIGGGVENAPLNARALGATGFGMFTKNQRQWHAKPYTEENIRKFKENMAQNGFSADAVLPHDTYLINLGHPEPEKRQKSWEAFLDEVRRVESLGLKYLNFHPGSHLKAVTPSECMAHIAASMNSALKASEGVTLLIENSAGQGTSIGRRFEELAEIISQVEDKTRVGVCLDTCHLFAGGYDLRTPEQMEAVWEEFDHVVGWQYLKGMHLNDAKSELGSRVDRHHSLGEGRLGWDPFTWIMKDPRLNHIPLVLETINPDLWPREVKDLLAAAED